MKRIELTQGKFCIVDDYDYEYLSEYNWYANVANRQKNKFYARRSVNLGNKSIKGFLMHRQIMGVTDPKILIDHINGDGLDNRRCNLRIVTSQQNQFNSTSKGGRSIYKGVSFHIRDKKWYARITRDYKLITIGSFSNEVDAALAYNKKALELFGEFALLNVV